MLMTPEHLKFEENVVNFIQNICKNRTSMVMNNGFLTKRIYSWVIFRGIRDRGEYRLFSLLMYDNQMGMKKYNSYAPRESLGKRPRPPILAPKWVKWAPNSQKISKPK